MTSSRRQLRRATFAQSQNVKSLLRQTRISRRRLSQSIAIDDAVRPGLDLMKASFTSSGLTLNSVFRSMY